MALASRIDEGSAPLGDHADPSAGTAAEGTFRREGEYWTIEYGARSFRMRDAKGMHHLARLLGAPGRELHAVDLAGMDAQAGATATLEAGGFVGDVSLVAGDGVGANLDAEAKASYRARLVDLRDELTEARSWNDPERVARLETEVAALTRELAAAVGLGGRDRPAVSSGERARVSVTRAIRAVLSRIKEHDPALGAHLDATIRTGTFCSYTPDPRVPIAWRL
jgi:hypothetical protein